MALAILETLLFLWLSPGVLFTFPPIDGRWFSTDTTSWQAVLTHAALMFLILFLLSRPRSREGFQATGDQPQLRAVSPVGQQRTGSAVARRLAERKWLLENL